MSKFIKLLSVILIIFALIISFYSVYATSDINMNLVADNQDTDVLSSNVTDNTNSNVENTSVQDTILPGTQSDTLAPTSTTSIAEEGLGFSNILSILLITVGVILILLSIAILIRLK